jgi:hypothetical protein
LSDVFWRLVLSSCKGYLNWVQILKLRVLSEAHEPRDVLFDKEIGQASSNDFGSVPLAHHFGVTASFVPARNEAR